MKSISAQLEEMKFPMCVVCNKLPRREYGKTCSFECGARLRRLTIKKYQSSPGGKEVQRLSSARYYRKHRERILERNKRWSTKNKDKLKRYYQKYYKKNKEEILRKQGQYYLKHRDRILARKKK